MKILHINSYYAEGKFYQHLYNEQVKAGTDIDVFVPSPSPVIRDLGPYAKVRINHGKYDKYIFHLKHHKIFKDAVNQYKIDDYTIIHAHSLFSNGYIAMKLKREFGIPYVTAVRNADVNAFFKYMVHLRGLGVKILEEADQIVFLSEAYKDEVINKYIPEALKTAIAQKSKIIPNGIDSFWFENRTLAKEKPSKDSLKLLYVGAVNKNKNITTIVKAIRIMQKNGYRIHFTIVGKIHNKSIYKKIIANDFVNYYSEKSREDLLVTYRKHDMFIMPSIYETFGLVYAEAMSQALPVIYSRGQGFDRQFKEGVVGFSVNSFDAHEIAERMVEILGQYSEMSYSASEKSQKFSWPSIAMLYKELYKDIINNSSYQKKWGVEHNYEN